MCEPLCVNVLSISWQTLRHASAAQRTGRTGWTIIHGNNNWFTCRLWTFHQWHGTPSCSGRRGGDQGSCIGARRCGGFPWPSRYLLMLNRCSSVGFSTYALTLSTVWWPVTLQMFSAHTFWSALSLRSRAGSGLCRILTNQLSLKLLSWNARYHFARTFLGPWLAHACWGFKLERDWSVVAQCTRGIGTLNIACCQGLLVLGHIQPQPSEIAQNAGEHLVAGLEAAISHQVNLAIPWWWNNVSVQASTNVYEWTLAVFANLSVEDVFIKSAQTICKPINIPFLKIQAQSMVSKPICNITIQHIQKNECNQYPIIYT